jgi:hypothetical protein
MTLKGRADIFDEYTDKDDEDLKELSGKINILINATIKTTILFQRNSKYYHPMQVLECKCFTKLIG